MDALNYLLALQALCFALTGAQPDPEEYALHSDDPCQSVPAMRVRVAPPGFTDAGPGYQNLSLLAVRGKPLHRLTNRQRKQEQQAPAEHVALSFDYRVEGRRLFFLTDVVGRRQDLPVACSIEEEVLFRLDDPVGTVRRLTRTGCSGPFTTQLLRKEAVAGDTLYTFGLARGPAPHADAVSEIAFNGAFQVKAITYSLSSSMVVAKGMCVPASILRFK